MIKFEVGQRYDFPGLYTPGYTLACIARDEKTVTFAEGHDHYIYKIEEDEDSERILVWSYGGHEGYCWAEPEESRWKRYLQSAAK